MLFLIIGLLIVFFTAAGIFLVTNAVLWALFCLFLGLLLAGVPLQVRKNQP